MLGIVCLDCGNKKKPLQTKVLLRLTCSQYVTEIHQQYFGFTTNYVEILNDAVITVSS